MVASLLMVLIVLMVASLHMVLIVLTVSYLLSGQDPGSLSDFSFS